MTERVSFVYKGAKPSSDIRERVETVTIDPSVTTIKQRRFNSCTRLQTVTIPSTVSTIEENAFSNCASLHTVTIQSSATTIRRGAFERCPNLSEKSIKSITDCFVMKKHTHETFFEAGPGPRFNFEGSTQNGWGPEMWGITFEQIQNIMNHPCVNFHTSLRDVVRLVIKPATKQRGLGYALLLNQEKPLHANVMVSVSSETLNFDAPYLSSFLFKFEINLQCFAFSFYLHSMHGMSPLSNSLGV